MKKKDDALADGLWASGSARWIASDALRGLTAEKIPGKLRGRNASK
jgi:hypothetical protein